MLGNSLQIFSSSHCLISSWQVGVAVGPLSRKVKNLWKSKHICTHLVFTGMLVSYERKCCACISLPVWSVTIQHHNTTTRCYYVRMIVHVLELYKRLYTSSYLADILVDILVSAHPVCTMHLQIYYTGILNVQVHTSTYSLSTSSLQPFSPK